MATHEFAPPPRYCVPCASRGLTARTGVNMSMVMIDASIYIIYRDANTRVCYPPSVLCPLCIQRMRKPPSLYSRRGRGVNIYVRF